MELSTINDFDAIYEIMEEAFPPIERRTYEKQKALFHLSHYHVHTLKEKECIKAFISVWEYPDFIFVEHLAIASSYRNQGLGAKLLNEIIAFYKKHVILEVELPQTDLAKRRIGFYERLGFKCNSSYIYEQPPLQHGFEPYPLWLMSYPERIDSTSYKKIKEQLYQDVYGILDERS